MVETSIFPTRLLVGLSRPFIAAGHENSTTQSVIGPLWEEVSHWFFSLDVKRDDNPIGVGAMWPIDDGLAGEMVYFAGYEVRAFPDQLGALKKLEVQGGKYAHVTHVKPLNELPETVIEFYCHSLPASGQVRRRGMDLEIYQEADSSGKPRSVVVAAPIA
jgi:predicted transcriptional regulator YdeE